VSVHYICEGNADGYKEYHCRILLSDAIMSPDKRAIFVTGTSQIKFNKVSPSWDVTLLARHVLPPGE